MTQQWCTGRLLVALPALDDPNFARSVVFVIEHDEDGALGLVLNRPTTTPIEDILAGWSLLAAEPANLYGNVVDVGANGMISVTFDNGSNMSLRKSRVVPPSVWPTMTREDEEDDESKAPSGGVDDAGDDDGDDMAS